MSKRYYTHRKLPAFIEITNAEKALFAFLVKTYRTIDEEFTSIIRSETNMKTIVVFLESKLNEHLIYHCLYAVQIVPLVTIQQK